MKYFISILSLTLFVLSSCCRLENIGEEPCAPVYTASIEEIQDTRTYVDQSLKMLWNADDRLSIFTTTYNQQYKFTGETGDSSGRLEAISPDGIDSGTPVSTNYAVYPYSSSIVLTKDEKISLTLPAVQKYARGSFGSGANTMVAVAADRSDYFLPFKNLCGYLVLELYGEGTVKSVSITGNNGEKLAGTATVSASYGSAPALVFEEGATGTITVDCGDGVALGTDEKHASGFWFCIPPVTFSKGFTIRIVNAKDAVIEMSTSLSGTVTRNQKFSISPKYVNNNAAMPPAEKGYSETGIYRNYLAELGIPQADINKKIADTYSEIFENPKRGAYKDVVVGDKKMGYVSDVKNGDVRSEGMSYAMMVAVQLDKRELFDKLWRWANEYMRHNDPKEASYGLFAWQCRPNGTRMSQGSASDGELYFVTDLLLAARRWGNNGEIKYLDEAQKLLGQLFSKKGTGGVTNIINMDHLLINFCPDTGSNGHTDPSYHLPAFYEIWAETANDGREDIYRTLAKNAREFLHKATNSVTGLNPDQSNFDGTPYGWGSNREFHYDSWRVPMNIAMDFTWYHKDAEWQSDYAARIVEAVVGKYGLTTFPDQFALNGGKPNYIMGGGSWPANLRHSIGFVGTMATTSLMIDGQYSQDLVRHMFEMVLEPYPDGYYDVYYDGFLYLFALLHLSGNYRMSW